MIRQAYHDFALHHIRHTILSLSKDEIRIPESVRNRF
jgi:hypothetical protein